MGELRNLLRVSRILNKFLILNKTLKTIQYSKKPLNSLTIPQHNEYEASLSGAEGQSLETGFRLALKMVSYSCFMIYPWVIFDHDEPPDCEHKSVPIGYYFDSLMCY